MKPLSEFQQKKRNKDGYSGKCKSCVSARNKKYYEKNKETYYENSKRYWLKKSYGLSEEEYIFLLTNQENKCKLCERDADQFPTRLAVDHNHLTGEIRGLLCNYCNHRVVGNNTDGAKFRKIADYLDQGTGRFAPRKSDV